MNAERLDARQRPLPLVVLRRCFEFSSSSALATTMIGLVAAVLAWATWVENAYGTAAVQFGIYQSWWFAALLALLGVNVLAAALIRFPWQRKQIGFLIVHAGILVLLAGCWISQKKGVHAELHLYEGDSGTQAMAEEQQLTLAVRRTGPRPDDRDSKDSAADSSDTRIVEIPFRPGPFNWVDYDRLGWFPWRWAHRDRGIVFDEDGVRLEVLDYCGNSRRVAVPELRLRLPAEATLTVREVAAPHLVHRTLLVGSQAWAAARITFQMATSAAETNAFRDSRPVGPLGRLGQIVLHAGGKKYPLAVEDLEGKGSVPLGDSGLRVELGRLDPESLRVLLAVYARDDEAKSSGLLLLNAARPELDQQDRTNGVWGTYWFARSERPASEETEKKKTSDEKKSSPEENKDATAEDSHVVPEDVARAAAEPRVDILQGADRKLYYRAWRGGRVETIGELPDDGSDVVVFADMNPPLKLAVASFLPAARPEDRVVPIAFDKEGLGGQSRVRARLTVAGHGRTFWLADSAGDDSSESFGGARGKGRMAMLRLARPIVDLGFQVRLREFTCEFDPGTSRASHYESRVDFLTADKEALPLEENVAIALNRPARFTDPTSGRTYRIFQMGYDGPYAPEQLGMKLPEETKKQRDGIYRSILAVAYDPGRELKYTGCLMIMAGIMVMYYMKAYFFRPRGKTQTENAIH
ncbi:MAG TPA: hypothetical protein VJL29_00465 [Thermoguttaceae bacterium]|nr:hypothetical protein [Thermoguttaceae bacterium]